MTIRDWQLRLKSELAPQEYRLVTVTEWPPGIFTANVLHPDTRAVIAVVKLQGDPLPDLRALLVTARAPVNRDQTIIPHYPST